LVSSTRDELIPPPPRPSSDIMRPAASFVSFNARRQNPLGPAHDKLSIAPPLTFQELSWPTPDQWGAIISDVYRDSAQLFVDRLLSLKDGRDCLRTMLELLPDHYNWQFAFLRAFNSHFQRPLDIEKWWALEVVEFTGRDLNQTWPPDESWRKLDELVRSEVQIRFGTNDLPVHAEVPLQTIVGTWEYARQTQALLAKIHELEMLRPRVAKEFVPLVDQYRSVISTYLQNREHPGGIVLLTKKAAVRRIEDETIQQLANLDQQRAALRPSTQKTGSPKANSESLSKDQDTRFPNQARSDH